LSLFAKEQMSDRSYFALFKRQQKERSLFPSFKKSDKKSDRSFALSKRAKEQKRAIAHFQNDQMANPGCRVGQSLICSSLIYTPFKRAIEQLLAHLLF